MITGGTSRRLSRSRSFPVALLALLLLAVAAPDITGIRRALATVSVRHHFLGWHTMESAHFHLRFKNIDREEAEWVAAEAERVALLVATKLEYRPTGSKPWLVIAPDQNTISRAFGWGD